MSTDITPVGTPPVSQLADEIRAYRDLHTLLGEGLATIEGHFADRMAAEFPNMQPALLGSILLRAASMVGGTVNDVPDLPAPAVENLLGMAGESLYRRKGAPADGAYRAGGDEL
jgi:hypothetical protein